MQKPEVKQKRYSEQLLTYYKIDGQTASSNVKYWSNPYNYFETGKRNRQHEHILKPKAIINYNKAKKGVDFNDQMISYHSILRKSLKWYRILAFEFLFGTAIVDPGLSIRRLVSQNCL